MRRKVVAIILAAGQGKRFRNGHPKQFRAFKGEPIFLYSLKAFLHSHLIDRVFLMVPKRHKKYAEECVGKLHQRELVEISIGGTRRQDSVYKGLRKVPEDTGFVLIHDAARPLVTKELISRVLKGAISHGCCIPVIASPDTIKEVTRAGFIKNTVSRDRAFLVQTPQAFAYKRIMRAYEKADFCKNFTDDAQLAESMGLRIKVVAGERTNIKVTWKEDIYFLKVIHGAKKQRSSFSM